MTFLLDVNVLIALIDTRHIHHDIAHHWFEREGQRRWASCPLTENGVIRIVSAPGYANRPGSPHIIVQSLRGLCDRDGHEFWPDDLSYLNSTIIEEGKVRAFSQITDTYLLALAVSRGGKLATLDRRLATGAVKGGSEALHLVS